MDCMTVQHALYALLCTLLLPQVTVSGTTVMFSGSMGNVTGLAVMNGVTYSVSVVARNSVGNSEMFIDSFRAPCEQFHWLFSLRHMYMYSYVLHPITPCADDRID